MATKAELKALRGLPHLPRLLYHEAIRPRMNYATGYVGVLPGSRISWNVLSEDIEVESSQGIEHWRPTRKMLQRATEQLEKRGLIRRCTVNKQLMFLCLLASTDQSAQIKVAHKWRDQTTPPETPFIPCIPGDNTNQKPESGATQNAEAGHTSVIRNMSECVSDAERERDWCDFFQYQYPFNAMELADNIRAYIEHCRSCGKEPRRQGCKALLESRAFFQQQRQQNQVAMQELHESRRMKVRAIAQREEDTADRIHSGNIHQRQEPFTASK